MRTTRSSATFIDRIAEGLFRAQGRGQRVPHPLFGELYDRVHAALDEAELCLHAEVTSRPNLVEVFFHFETWGRYVAPRQAQVQQAIEWEIEAHRRFAGYGEEERIVLRLFVADPAQHEVRADRPSVIARRVPDPLAYDARFESALKHTTVVGGKKRSTERRTSSKSTRHAPDATRATPLAVLEFTEAGRMCTREIFEPGVFGRGSGSTVQVHADPAPGHDPAEIVSRRALELSVEPCTGELEIKNVGRWPLEIARVTPKATGSKLEPSEILRVEREAELLWPGLGEARFRLLVRAPRRGTLTLRARGKEQRVVLRAPRTTVRADPAKFEACGVAFHVDFVDGTRFLVLNNEGTAPLRMGTLEGKQIQWPIDAPRELEAGDLAIAIELEDKP